MRKALSFKLDNLKTKFNKMVFPEKMTCNFCGEEIFKDNGHNLCNECLNALPLNISHICLHCGTSLTGEGDYCIYCKGKTQNYEMARSLFLYDGNIAFAIQGSKFENKKYLFSTFAYFLQIEYNKLNYFADVIIPVPLHEERLKERGYNQSELLANELSKLIGVPVDSESLIKHKATKIQTKLNFYERQQNLKNAFRVRYKNKLKGKNILLIDDVFTTGSTINNCSIALKNAGVKNIIALTIAHTCAPSE